MLLKANAKINLTLDIVRRMENGYHELDSIMRTVSLCDKLEMTESDMNAFGVTGGFAPMDGSNLCIKARDAFFQYTGVGRCVHIKLYKFIPSGAGLGGGSADAAAVLRGMNILFGTRLSVSELRQIGATLGADVPFCITGGTARCRGIGDVLTPVYGIPRMFVVVAKGKSGLSTPSVYSMLDRHTVLPTGNYTERMIGDKNNAALYISNGFEPVCASMCEDIDRIKALHMQNGAVTACMSGSGSSVYGIYAERSRAEAAAVKMRAMGLFAACCITL